MSSIVLGSLRTCVGALGDLYCLGKSPYLCGGPWCPLLSWEVSVPVWGPLVTSSVVSVPVGVKRGDGQRASEEDNESLSAVPM